MKVRRAAIAVVASGCLLVTSSTLAHDKPPGPLDGKWVGESVKCFPAMSTFRFTKTSERLCEIVARHE